MDKKQPLTYQSIADACTQLVKSGGRPSVRKLHAQLGGSFSTISEYLQRWNQQTALAQSAEADISDHLKQALLAEFGQIAQSVRHGLEQQLEDQTQQLAENQKLLKEYEDKNRELGAQLQKSQQQLANQAAELEKTIAAHQAQLAEKEQREAKLDARLQQLMQEKHLAEVKTAIAQTRVEECEKRITALEKGKK